MSREHIHFATGRLAEHALRAMLAELAPRVGFDYSISVLGISVAALMTPVWVARHLRAPPESSRVLVPGYCEGDLTPIVQSVGRPVERGPKDLRELPEFFGDASRRENYGAYNIEIVAEINYAPRSSRAALVAEARRLAADGADVIDLGGDPAAAWPHVSDAVKAIRDLGLRVAVDTFDPTEVALAARAGAELVFSVNSTNLEAALDWGCAVVAIPDQPGTLEGLETTYDRLHAANVPVRIDPILAPIGFGFAASLERYIVARRRWPEAEMLMGVGNVSELTDVDSAGVNVLLLALCEEWGVRSVLTTQVINWARSSVRECDVARRLARYAVAERTLPKHMDPSLLVLRDGRLREHGEAELLHLASTLKDRNYRLFAEREELHLMNSDVYLRDADPFALFERLLATQPKNLNPRHAFYLGYELAKATTALTLHKNYRQDQALDWGHLTREETSHRAKTSPNAPGDSHSASDASTDGPAPASPGGA
jgi:dihydropteroate synthase